MVRNPERRAQLTDAAIRVLAREGARGLTHRAVDDEAGVPRGTAANYFSTRAALFAGLVERIAERVSFSEAAEIARTTRAASAQTTADYLRASRDRLLADRDLAVAYFEVRLEAMRRPEIHEMVGEWMRASVRAEVEFAESRGFAGGPKARALFHFAVEGMVLDELTVPVAPVPGAGDLIDHLVTALLAAED
jgi:DNA-binding transcriptional regulator YbjK